MKGSRRTYQVSTAATTILAWLLVGTVSYHALEDWTWIQSLYFSAVTLTTIGYGDFHPTTDESRLFTVFYIFFGVFAVLSAITIVGSWHMQRRINNSQEKHRHDSRQ